ncbi:cytochrome c1 [Phenylobacterium aquaticum]|uniref:cytochrome c1 n=1 Tax=Phenylobacterium aquaticum TaxID=1763816 RepID=UPI0026EE3687|nr:cytochrome c1 [Phenylobacterium aquaticum]
MLRKGLALAALGLALVSGSAVAGASAEEPQAVHWSFEGPFGKFDQAQLQRGYKVYREVCSACHSMNLMSFRNLGQKGGPFYDEKYKNPNDNPYVKAIAKDYQVNDIDSETGDVVQRPGTSADKFPNPFPNEPAARASNGGALPPDLSDMAKARELGPRYIYSILTGYEDAGPNMTVPPGKHYNPYMPGDMGAFWKGSAATIPEGGFIAMPPPLVADKVTFDDGTKATLDQEAKDVVAFLVWASEPKMEERKSFGLAAMIYLLIFTGLLYVSYKRIWRNVSH